MRPDVEEYEDIEEGSRSGHSRAMSWMVLAVAVGGFAALAYYAYHSGNTPAADEETMMVEADPAPIRQAPESAEGEQFPNKDKTIYDVISPSGQASAKAEKLLPEPEHPVAAANTEDSEDDAPVSAAAAPEQAKALATATAAAATSTFVAGGAAQKADPVDKPVAATPMANTASPAAQAVSEQPVATSAKPVVEAAAKPEASYATPHMVNEKTLTGKKEEAAPETKAEPKKEAKPIAAKKPEPKKEAKPTAKPAAGSAMVQLGAFKSEAEAQSAWKKVSAAHGDVLKGAPSIVKAEVNEKTYYRLRTSVADAKAVCAKVQPCVVVK